MHFRRDSNGDHSGNAHQNVSKNADRSHLSWSESGVQAVDIQRKQAETDQQKNQD